MDNTHVIVALKKAEKMRIEFVANVSHELRTPLTSIKGYTETLLLDLEEGREADPEFLKIILKNSNRLLALIDDLLDLSAIESGALEINVTDLNPNESLQHVLERIEPIAQAKKTKIITHVNTQLIQADPKRIEQVLANLIDNAIKYCPPQSTITVTFNEAADATILTVADNGPGIAEKYLDRLFQRFYRLDKGRSRETGGTGLGLSIVKHIMQRHNGSVSAASQIGQGTIFTCTFPKLIQSTKTET